jgi:hypothetical protein
MSASKYSRVPIRTVKSYRRNAVAAGMSQEHSSPSAKRRPRTSPDRRLRSSLAIEIRDDDGSGCDTKEACEGLRVIQSKGPG